jgi:hypothetical protein
VFARPGHEQGYLLVAFVWHAVVMKSASSTPVIADGNNMATP